MLNRRVLRVRVLQFLYSYYSLLKFNDEPKQLKGDFVRKISNSLQEINKYYYKYLSIAIFLSDVNNEKREIAKSEKIKKSESRFNLSGNKVIDFLRKNKQFIDNLIRYDISWSSKSEEIRNWYNLILGEEITKNYLLLSNPDFNDDFEYVKKLVNKILFKNEDIILYFENQNIHWSDDRLIIRSMIKKTIESLNSPNFNTFAFANLSEDIKDDINFASSLFDSTVDNTSEYDEYIIKNSKNWKLDRISLMDKSILRMGIDEMIHFPNIPIKVTMNECIDIAKDYSTPKSGLFINGVLDVISLNLQKKGIIKKSGKGLIDNNNNIMSKNSTNSLISLLLGLIVGGVLGVLFAPDKGNNTRDRLNFRLNKYKRKLEDLIDDIVDEKDDIKSEAKENSNKVVNDAKTKAEKLLKDVDGILSKIKEN